MTVGEQWVATNTFPILMVVLALWILAASCCMIRNWRLIKNLHKTMLSMSAAAEITSTVEMPDDIETDAAVDTLKALRVKLNK